jgi:hypothetical protein
MTTTFFASGEPDDTSETAIAELGKAIEAIERRQAPQPTDSARLQTLRAATEGLLARIARAEDADAMARWRGRSKRTMSRSEMVQCVAEIGSRRFLTELPE